MTDIAIALGLAHRFGRRLGYAVIRRSGRKTTVRATVAGMFTYLKIEPYRSARWTKEEETHAEE